MEAGAQIPGENHIMSRFDVTRTVARRAILELENRFLVRRARGSGTFVNKRIDYVISHTRRPSLHKTVEAAGGQARTFLIGSGTGVAPSQISDRFGCPQGRLLTRLERIGYINGRIAVYFEEWINAGVMDEIEVALPVIESVEEILRAKGHHPVRAWTRGMVDVPPDQVIERLELAHGAHAWSVESLTTDRDSHKPLMFSSAWTRLDVVRMVFELDQPPENPGP